ncbi:hypothetical protein BKA93DRAFT_928911 [Sparassis latifolia]
MTTPAQIMPAITPEQEKYSSRVRTATSRSESKAKHLHKTFKSYSDKLDIVIIEDIPKDGTFNETVKGVVAIEHTTSPFHFNALEPDELIGPAATCRAHSSTALHELDGNNKSIEEVEEQGHNVLGASKYRASKTLAGRAAWDFVAKNDEQLNWDLILLNPHTSSSQATFSIPGADNSEFYELKWPVQNVAIIGAGVRFGLMAYRELTRAGLQAHIFERDRVPGGNWYYSEETPLDAPIPNADIEVGDFVPSLLPAEVELPYTEEYKDNYADIKRGHRGPKPLWESLHSNVPASYRTTNWGNTYTSYNTRVERVDKYIDESGNEHGWKLLLKKLVQTDYGTLKATWYTQVFDAVVIAVGHYNAPHIPPIAGLPEVAQVFPDRLTHSRQYHHPEPYASETVLIVGTSVSGAEISRNLNPFAKKIYQSIRPDKCTWVSRDIGMQSFTYSEYLSMAFSKMWTKKAFLPSRREMWWMHEERVKDRGG